MAKLQKVFERFRNKQDQRLILWCEASSRNEVDNNSYDDFKADLYINNKYIADISPVLDNAGVFRDMVDEIDWAEMLADELAEAGCNL